MHALETMNPTDRFWDRIADRYAAKPVPDQAVYERKLQITRTLLHPQAEVLELGCGTGSTALALAPCAGHILATDVSSRMVAIARDKAAAAGIDNVNFQRRGADEIRALDGSVDAVLAHSLLHLVEDWRGVITAAHRMLAPGGALIMTTMSLKDGYGFMRPVAPLGRRLGLLPQLSFFTRAELEAAMEAAGFTIEHAWLPGKRRGIFHVARKPR